MVRPRETIIKHFPQVFMVGNNLFRVLGNQDGVKVTWMRLGKEHYFGFSQVGSKSPCLHPA